MLWLYRGLDPARFLAKLVYDREDVAENATLHVWKQFRRVMWRLPVGDRGCVADDSRVRCGRLGIHEQRAVGVATAKTGLL